MRYILILLILTSAVLAETYYYSGDTIKVDSEQFKIRLSEDDKMLAVTGPDSVVLMDGECKTTDSYKFCFEKTKNDFNAGYGQWDDEQSRVTPAIFITITSLKADIKVTRTASTKEPFEYEIVTITNKYENKGSKDALITYVENVTGLTECEKCSIVGDQVIYQTTVAQSDTKSFSYKFKATNNVTLSPTITYKTDISNGSLTSDSLKIVPKKTLSITYEGPKKLVVGKEYSTKAVFKNNDLSERITFDTYIRAKGLELKSDKELEGILQKGESDSFDIKFTATKSGDAEIIFENDYSLGSKKLNSTYNLELENEFKKPVITIETDTSIFSDMEKNFEVSVKTTDNNLKNIISNITIEKSDIFTIPYFRNFLEATIYDKNFIIITDTKKDVTSIVNLNYESLYGEKFSESKSVKLTVKPMIDIVSIDHDMLNGKLLTYITNNDEDKQTFNITQNGNKRLITIQGKQKTKVFDVEPQNLNVSVLVSGAKNEYMITQFYNHSQEKSDKTIKIVEEKEYIETGGAVLQDSMMINETEEITKEIETTLVNNDKQPEKSFWAKIMDWIAGWF